MVSKKTKKQSKPKPKPAAKTREPKGPGRTERETDLAGAALLGRLESLELRLERLTGAVERVARPEERQNAPRPAAVNSAPSAVLGSQPSDPDTAQFLSRNPLFANLDPQECGVLATFLEARTVPAGQLLFHEGDFGDALYIVKSGALEILKKDFLGPIRVAEIRPGGLVGEMALVENKPRSANVRASEETRLLSLSRSSYGDLKKAQPALATKFQDELLLLLASRLRQTTEKLVGNK